MKGPKTNHLTAIAGLFPALVTLALFWPVAGFPFISIDDHEYIYENSMVKAGVTWNGIAWAFTTGHASNWHPLTWLSHMLDCQLFGLNAGAHHLVNVAFHIANSLLLLLLLRQMTGSIWRSTFVAALFAWHPLHIESVAWASERKDLLSACFWMLTMMAYVNYSRARDARADKAGRWYGLALVFFAAGLMSKPMVVTLPCVLLLLDFWPLERVTLSKSGLTATPGGQGPTGSFADRFRGLVREKLPFFALTAISCIVTVAVQHSARSSLESLPVWNRVSNALIAYISYLAMTFWPVNQSCIYPYTRHLSPAVVLGAATLLASLTVLLLARVKRQPWAVVGWLWFLGTLVPTIGLIQVGSQSMADRYMYIPSIGLFLLVVWTAQALCRNSMVMRNALAAAGVAALAACLVLSHNYLGYWESSEKLFRRATQVTTDNFLAHSALGGALAAAGRGQEAFAEYKRAVELEPRDSEAQYNLGTALMNQGTLDQATEHLLAAVRIRPRFAQAHINLGKILMDQGKPEAAVEHFAEAVALTPNDPEAHFNLATCRLRLSQIEAAVPHLLTALRLRPDYADAHANLGVCLMRQGKLADGAAHLAAAARLAPESTDAQFNYGVALLQLGQPAQAIGSFQTAARLAPDNVRAQMHLAIAYTLSARFTDAIQSAELARSMASAAGDADLTRKAEAILKSARLGQPYRE